MGIWEIYLYMGNMGNIYGKYTCSVKDTEQRTKN